VAVTLSLTLLWQTVAVEANYTRATLTLVPRFGPAQTIAFESIRRVATESVRNSNVTRVLLSTSDGPVPITTVMAAEAAVEGLERMLSKARKVARAQEESRSAG
jgi:hypothetical protein